MSYAPPSGTCNATWVGAAAYAPPYSVVPGDWQGRVALYAVGFAAGAVGTPPLVAKQQFVNPAGFQPTSGGSPLATLDWQYIPPYATVNGVWVAAAAYTAPSGEVDGEWYVALPGEDQYIFAGGDDHLALGAPRVPMLWPQGIAQTAFGTAELVIGWIVDASWVGAKAYAPPPAGTILATWRTVPFGTLAPWGFANAQFGVVATHTQEFVRPAGTEHVAFGTAAQVRNWTQTAHPDGIAAPAISPYHWISLHTRRVKVVGDDHAHYGSAAVESGIRTVDQAGRSIVATLWGGPTITYRVREVRPSWFVATLYGTTLVDRHHQVLPGGIDPDPADGVRQVGQPDVQFPRDFVDLSNLGISGPQWGEHTVGLWVQPVAPRGFTTYPTPHEQVGDHGKVELWRRYVRQLDETTVADGGVFGPYALVLNRNMTVRAEGVAMTRYGRPEVSNKARLVHPPMYLEFTEWGRALVAPRVRSFPFDGFDAAYFSRWTQVHNAARSIAPAGLDALSFSAAKVWFNRQTLTRIGAGDQSAIGTAWVSSAPREVAQHSAYAGGRGGWPRVSNWQQYAAPPGVAPPPMGWATVEERFTVARPHGWPSEQLGVDARVRNLTPELGMLGSAHTLWGAAAVRTQWRAIAPGGLRFTQWGTAIVRDRRSWVRPVPGLDAWRPSFYTEVRNVVPDPPAERTIGALGAAHWSAGNPTLTFNTVYQEGATHTQWGALAVTRMGISPPSILPPYDETTGLQFGVPHIPRAQYIVPTDAMAQQPWTGWGEPRIDPHYIWAPRGYPYTTGAEVDRGHIMDAMNPPERQPGFGAVVVAHRHRAIQHEHDQWDNGGVFTSFGNDGRVSTNPQYARPDGLRSFRYGVPRLNEGGRIEQYSSSDMAEYGLPAVARAAYLGPQTAAPPGIGAPAPQPPRVEHFHRAVAPQGFDTFAISQPLPPAWPRQSHWISHEYPPFPAQGFEATLWGTTWVSHYVRALPVEGWDSFVCDYEPGYFARRMRVWVRSVARDVTLGAQGAVGQPGLSHGTRHVTLAGIRQDRVGVPRARAVGTLAVPGWDSIVFGDVQRWEAGKIKPHGDDLAAFGRAILHQVVFAEPVDVGAVDAPRVAARIRAVGYDALGTATPAIIAAVCGDKTVAGSGFDAMQFGTAKAKT